MYCVTNVIIFEGREGWFVFPFLSSAQISTYSQCPRAQIPSSQWLSSSNLNPISIFCHFIADESKFLMRRKSQLQPKISKSHSITERVNWKLEFVYFLVGKIGFHALHDTWIHQE